MTLKPRDAHFTRGLFPDDLLDVVIVHDGFSGFLVKVNGNRFPRHRVVNGCAGEAFISDTMISPTTAATKVIQKPSI